MEKETFKLWHKKLLELGGALSVEQDNQPSPWVNMTIAQSLSPDNDECWLDRYAAGYSPEEALAEALEGD